jgi:hypothetical protein
VRNASDLPKTRLGRQSPFDLTQIIGSEPTPEFAAMTADECRRLLDLLQEPRLVSLAIAKMQGYRNRETRRATGRFTNEPSRENCTDPRNMGARDWR